MQRVLKSIKATYRKSIMAKEKTVNYTAEQTATMVADYVANPTKETVDALAVMLGRTSRSIIAKLAREKVYVAKEYKTKAGEKPVKKDEHADKLAELCGLTEAEADSLTKANKTALVKILATLADLQEESAAALLEAETD
jgi:uncharacterized protein YutE (UPF0331/DUF86 family)